MIKYLYTNKYVHKFNYSVSSKINDSFRCNIYGKYFNRKVSDFTHHRNSNIDYITVHFIS